MVEISRNISLLSGGILLSLLVARFIILEDANLRPTSFAASKQELPLQFYIDQEKDESIGVELSNDKPAAIDQNSFLESMDALATLSNKNATLSSIQSLLDTLITSLIQEPINPPVEACEIPLLMQAKNIDCSKYPTAFTKTMSRQTPVKVAHLVQLGFDADMLELLLRELNDVVDKFFIIESTRTHNKGIRKILLWDHVKNQPRFEFVKEKVVHMVLDDTEAFLDSNEEFAIEKSQERTRWESFLRWNNHTQFFGPNDLVGFGDVDEIPSRENVQLLRHCELAGPSVDIGSWFAPTRLSEAFRPDWPVPGNRWTLGDPTYWTVASATMFGQDGAQYPSRMRGTSGKFLLGGIHMTDNGYAPFRMAKLIACTECKDSAARLMTDMATIFRDNQTKEETLARLDTYLNPVWPDRKRFVGGEEMIIRLGAAYYIPWFLQCNPERFSSWYGNLDSRLHGS